MIAVGSAVALAGCGGNTAGPSRAAVAGIVSLDDQPLAEGVIRFVPDQQTTGPKASAKIINGRFYLPEEFGPVVGSHRIEIESTDDGGYPRDDETVLARLQAEKKRRIRIVRVPETYNRNSQLTAQIAPGQENQLKFQLQSQTPRRSR